MLKFSFYAKDLGGGLEGPPGTGKTRLAWRIADSTRIQFHPARTYEDFVVGLFPRPTSSGLAYRFRPRIAIKTTQSGPLDPGGSGLQPPWAFGCRSLSRSEKALGGVSRIFLACACLVALLLAGCGPVPGASPPPSPVPRAAVHLAPSTPTLDEFHRLPDVRKAFFRCGLHLLASRSGNGGAEVTVGSQPGVTVYSSLSSAEQDQLPETLLLQSRLGNEHRFQALLPDTGPYTLNLFACREGGNPELAVQYKVSSIHAHRGCGFPVSYSPFRDREVTLRSPLQGHLGLSRSIQFDLTVPEARDVFVQGSDAEWHHLERHSSDFRGEVPVCPGKVRVFASFNDAAQGESLLE